MGIGTVPWAIKITLSTINGLSQNKSTRTLTEIQADKIFSVGRAGGRGGDGTRVRPKGEQIYVFTGIGPKGEQIYVL